MKKGVKFLAAKIMLLAGSACFSSHAIPAGIPVFDVANFQQTVLSYVESVGQTLKQVEQYVLQLKQYENMITNTLAPAAYVWDKVQGTIGDITSVINTVDYYRNSAGNLDTYLSKFQNASYYRRSPCFKGAGCSDADWAELANSERLVGEAQKRANDAFIKGLDVQQDQLKKDAATLESLQRNAQGAAGHMAALQYANQLASNQTSQLLQIRSLLMAQMNAAATRAQAVLDKEGREEAARAYMRSGEYKESPAVGWRP